LAIQSDDFTAKLMDDMDARLLDFIKTKVNSFIKWDLVRIFYDNPNTTDSVENIAKYAGRNTADVQSHLEGLIESGVIEMQLVEGLPVYSLASDEEMRQLIEKFILACEDRHFRVKAVYHIIRSMR
jgi:predicted transcriptional regulator